MPVSEKHPSSAAGARQYDPMAPGFQDNLYEVYSWLRAEEPLYRHPESGIWAVSRYGDVKAVLSDWENFSSRTPSVPQPEGHLAVQDPPRHNELRRLVSKAFTPRQLHELGAVARDCGEALVARVDGEAEFDLVGQFAADVPSQVFAHMMGMPPADVPVFQHLLSDYLDALAAASIGTAPDDGPRRRVHEAIGELVAERRARPREDLLSRLIEAEVSGERLTDQEILGFCFNLILAANETTTNLLANGVATLYRHPHQLSLLRERPELLPEAIEEMVRFESPVQALHRTVVRDTPVAGGTAPGGAHLLVLYGAANRDETAFANPDRFDIQRGAGRHLAFGHGIHFCLGSGLARLEATEGFGVLLPVLARYEPAEERLAWKRSPWQRSLARLPLRRVGA
jgi:cytochrome P450